MSMNPARLQSATRGFALFLAGFTLLGLIASVRDPGLNLNGWWVDLRWLPRGLETACLLALAGLLVAFVAVPRARAWRRQATLAVAGFFAAVTLVNALGFWRLAGEGSISSGWLVPLSLAFFAGLVAVMADVRNEMPSRTQWLPTATAFGLCAMAFPMLQCVAFGKTDYRRSAEVAVVFGARAYADGRPSHALADRVRTACRLYQQGTVKRLVFSGGPGDGSVHETAAMTRMAVGLGVPASAISTDLHGLNTAATVHNTRADLAGRKVIVVSEFYHLPRIKLAYRSVGVEVFTVPAQPTTLTRALAPASVLREVPAFWAYTARATVGRL